MCALEKRLDHAHHHLQVVRHEYDRIFHDQDDAGDDISSPNSDVDTDHEEDYVNTEDDEDTEGEEEGKGEEETEA